MHPPSSQLTSRDLQALNTQAVIIDAAEELFLRDGFAGTSLGAIATAAKVSKALIVHHFKTKDALWQAVIDHHQQELRERLLGMIPACFDETSLRAFFLAYFAFLQERPDHVRFLLICCLDAPAGDSNDIVAEALLPALQAAQDAGLLRRDLPVISLAVALTGLARAWHANKALLPRPSVDDARHATALIDAYLNGCQTR